MDSILVKWKITKQWLIAMRWIQEEIDKITRLSHSFLKRNIRLRLGPNLKLLNLNSLLKSMIRWRTNWLNTFRKMDTKEFKIELWTLWRSLSSNKYKMKNKEKITSYKSSIRNGMKPWERSATKTKWKRWRNHTSTASFKHLDPSMNS